MKAQRQSYKSKAIRLEREGQGRYVVLQTLPGGSAVRCGLVLGGHGRWTAEDRAGGHVGTAASRQQAAALLAR